MLRRIFCALILSTSPFLAYAYQGDYVWEEKYNQLLPQALAGNAEAQYDVGEILERGRGVSRDPEKAFDWYLKSAKQGYTKGAYKAGLCYLKGHGVNKDFESALQWLQLSSDKGYERADYYLGVMYEKGEGVAANLTRALSYYKKALSAGYAPANDRIIDVKKAIDEEERIRSARAEAAARKQLAQRREEHARARKVTSKPPLTTKELLLKGGWNKRNQPAEYLPSEISTCKDMGGNLECLSSNVTRNIGVADIIYQTKSVIYSIDDSGSFKISYRNNVTDIKVTDPGAASKAKIPVKEGWQDAEHILECELEAEALVSCTKDKVRKVRFTRK